MGPAEIVVGVGDGGGAGGCTGGAGFWVRLDTLEWGLESRVDGVGGYAGV